MKDILRIKLSVTLVEEHEGFLPRGDMSMRVPEPIRKKSQVGRRAIGLSTTHSTPSQEDSSEEEKQFIPKKNTPAKS